MALNLPPTSADVRARIPVKVFQQLGFPPASSGSPDPLDSFCATAAAYVGSTTGRQVDDSLNATTPPVQVIDWLSGAGIGTYGSGLDLGPVGFRAVILRVVQEAMHESASYTRAVVGQDYLGAFKAGSYSEQRRPADTILHSRGSVSNPQINPWRELSDLLWLMLTDQMFEYWQMRLGGTPAPASVIVEGDFRDTWDRPSGVPEIPGFGPPGMGGDFMWPGGIDGGEHG